MAEAFAAISAAVAGQVTAFAAELGVTSLTASQVIYAATYYSTQALLYVGSSLAVGALAAPDVPRPESFATPYRSGRGPRVSAYGRNRLSGPAMLWEAVSNKGVAYDVWAIHDGQIEAIETLWLNDDIVTLDGSDYVDQGDDGRFGDNRIKIFTRMGLPTETSFTTETGFTGNTWTDLGVGVWTADHRGDGVASMCVLSKSVEKADMPNTFPNGAPLGSLVARCLRVHDWRETGQDIDDEDTWSCKFNPALQIADFLTHAGHGMAFEFAERITPAIDAWTDAANSCDEAVALKAGGTEPRYQAHGPFQHTSSPSDVLGRLLESCDGWLTTRGDGAFTLKAGAYYEPDVTFTDDHIIDYSLQRFVEDEQAVNVFVTSFTSPDHNFQEVETDPWKDEDDILSRGIERSQPLQFPWVQNNAQARRLAKRRMARAAATIRGTLVTDLYGLKGLGERYIRVQMSEIDALADIVVEVVSAEVDFMSMRVAYTWVAADENVDAWNPATEEGDGPSTEGRVAPEPMTAPTIDSVVVFLEAVSSGANGVRLRLEVTGPDRDDLGWFVRWRVEGGVSWNEAGYTDIDPDEDVVLETGFVPGDAMIEVQAAYSIGSGAVSPWSATETVFSALTDAGAFDFSDSGNSGLLPLAGF